MTSLEKSCCLFTSKSLHIHFNHLQNVSLILLFDNLVMATNAFSFTAWKGSIQIPSFSWSAFSGIRMTMERYSVSLRILSECGKIRTRKNSVSGNFSHSAASSCSPYSWIISTVFQCTFGPFIKTCTKFWVKSSLPWTACIEWNVSFPLAWC